MPGPALRFLPDGETVRDDLHCHRPACGWGPVGQRADGSCYCYSCLESIDTVVDAQPCANPRCRLKETWANA